MQHVMQILYHMEAVSHNGYIRKDGMDCCSIVGPQVRGGEGQLT
jgi:hypothetical protein